MNDIFMFNDIISHLGIVELPIKGQSFSWSHMQSDPLLVLLDWFYTTPEWTLTYPNTQFHLLAKPVSDHIPCMVKVDSKIPQAAIFHFENYQVQQPGFFELVANIWATPCFENSAKNISTKLKLLGKALKRWNGNISNMDKVIANCNSIIFMLDGYEEHRLLHLAEWNFREIVKNKLSHVLACKQDFWKNHCTICWVKFGDENTAFFHWMVTMRYRNNNIAHFTLLDGTEILDHDGKATVLWNSFKEWLGTSINPLIPTEVLDLI